MSCMCPEDLHWVYFIATLSSLRICQGIEYLQNSVVFQDNGSQGNPSVCDLIFVLFCFVCIEPHLRVYSIETPLKIHIPRFVEIQCQLYDTICGVPSDHPTKIQPSLASPESVPSVWSTRLSSSLRARLSVLKNSVTGSVTGSSPAQSRNRRWGSRFDTQLHSWHGGVYPVLQQILGAWQRHDCLAALTPHLREPLITKVKFQGNLRRQS